jgi:hypothetical protein
VNKINKFYLSKVTVWVSAFSILFQLSSIAYADNTNIYQNESDLVSLEKNKAELETTKLQNYAKLIELINTRSPDSPKGDITLSNLKAEPEVYKTILLQQILKDYSEKKVSSSTQVKMLSSSGQIFLIAGANTLGTDSLNYNQYINSLRFYFFKLSNNITEIKKQLGKLPSNAEPPNLAQYLEMQKATKLQVKVLPLALAAVPIAIAGFSAIAALSKVDQSYQGQSVTLSNTTILSCAANILSGTHPDNIQMPQIITNPSESNMIKLFTAIELGMQELQNLTQELVLKTHKEASDKDKTSLVQQALDSITTQYKPYSDVFKNATTAMSSNSNMLVVDYILSNAKNNDFLILMTPSFSEATNITTKWQWVHSLTHSAAVSMDFYTYKIQVDETIHGQGNLPEIRLSALIAPINITKYGKPIKNENMINLVKMEGN